MGYTFNAFVKFISDDPIMLGLCIAIIVLIILFVVVLFIGKRSDKKEESESNDLLKTEISMEPLKDTEQFVLDEVGTEDQTQEIANANVDKAIEESDHSLTEAMPVLEDIPAPSLEDIKEVPVTIEEPVPLEFDVDIENAPKLESDKGEVIESPIHTPSFEDYKIETPVPVEAGISQVEDQQMSIEPLHEENTPLIIESSVTPVEENIFDVKEPIVNIKNEETEIQAEDIEMPIMKTEEEEEVPSVYEDILAELPEIKIDAFDKTAILKTIPNMTPIEEIKEEPQKNEKEEEKESFDDIDLPKLNTNNTSSVLNSIKGESFDI